MRSRGFSPEESAQIISLAQARTRARAKFGERARTLMLTQEAAEQATRPVIAHYRTQRLRPVAGTVLIWGAVSPRILPYMRRIAVPWLRWSWTR